MRIIIILFQYSKFLTSILKPTQESMQKLHIMISKKIENLNLSVNLLI